MGRLVEPASAARRHRQPAAGGVRASVVGAGGGPGGLMVPSRPAPPSRRLGGELTSASPESQTPCPGSTSSGPHAAQRHCSGRLYRFRYHRQREAHRGRANPNGRVSTNSGRFRPRGPPGVGARKPASSGADHQYQMLTCRSPDDSSGSATASATPAARRLALQAAAVASTTSAGGTAPTAPRSWGIWIPSWARSSSLSHMPAQEVFRTLRAWPAIALNDTSGCTSKTTSQVVATGSASRILDASPYACLLSPAPVSWMHFASASSYG